MSKEEDKPTGEHLQTLRVCKKLRSVITEIDQVSQLWQLSGTDFRISLEHALKGVRLNGKVLRTIIDVFKTFQEFSVEWDEVTASVYRMAPLMTQVRETMMSLRKQWKECPDCGGEKGNSRMPCQWHDCSTCKGIGMVRSFTNGEVVFTRH
jgi:DnaJ-class molecular chaperone